MSIFQRRKNPEQLVKLLKEALASPSAPPKASKDGTAEDEVTKRLNQMKLLLYGEVRSSFPPHELLCSLMCRRHGRRETRRASPRSARSWRRCS